MATRTVVVASTASNQAKRVQTSATTWGDLKRQSDVAALIVGDVEAIVNPGRVTLGRDESALPEGNFQLFLVPTKNKAGYAGDYSGIGQAIGEAIRKAASLSSEEDVNDLKEALIETVADHFGVDVEDIGGGQNDDELKDALAEAKKYVR